MIKWNEYINEKSNRWHIMRMQSWYKAAVYGGGEKKYPTSGSKSWVIRMLFGRMSRWIMQPTLHSSWRYRSPRAAPTAIFCRADHSKGSRCLPEVLQSIRSVYNRISTNIMYLLLYYNHWNDYVKTTISTYSAWL